jgi:hypothetical protein
MGAGLESGLGASIAVLAEQRLHILLGEGFQVLADEPFIPT